MLYKLYTIIRCFLQPYWQPDPRKLTHKQPQQAHNATPVVSTPAATQTVTSQTLPTAVAAATPAVNKCDFTVITCADRLDRVWESDVLPGPMQCWYHHDASVHELFSHLLPNAGRRFTYDDRNQKARKRLKPLLYPQQHQQWDRTHLVPFGYHGSEADPRLVVGWDSEQNRMGMNEFEQKQKNWPMPIYWLARITRHANGQGATLLYMTWDARNMRLLDSAEFCMSCSFYWLP